MPVTSPLATESSVFRKDRGDVPPFLWRIFIGLSLLLLAGSVFRAATFPFVHDESLSFGIFTFAPQFAQTANHHLLNTWAMEVCARIFGNAEWSLRLPNLLGHLVYLGAVLALLRRLAHPTIQICAFVALNLNPFVLDFFFLARGYGMGLAALMASLVLLVRGSEEDDLARRRRWLLAALGLSAVAVLANYSFLFFFITLHAVVAIFYFPKSSRRVDVQAVVAVVLSGIFLVFVLSRIRVLASTGQLYFGGTGGFFSDTVRSLIESTLYRATYPHALVVGMVVTAAGLFVAAIGVAIREAMRQGRFPLSMAFAALLAGTALLPILGHTFGYSSLPIERAATQYLPLAAVAFVFALSDVWRAGPATGIALGVPVCALLLAAAGVVHFAVSYNVASCYVWSYDANDKEVISFILRDQRAHGITTTPTLTASWIFLPTFEFYRATLPRQCLASVSHLRYRTGHEDYAYVLESDAAPLATGNYSVLARFADTKTLLLRRR
jgi:hypothetical protein